MEKGHGYLLGKQIIFTSIKLLTKRKTVKKCKRIRQLWIQYIR